MVKGAQFVDLYFGESDGQNEAIRNPEAFVRSFVNSSATLEHVISGEKYLVLGPKGAGKSALAWYLKSTESLGNYIVTIRDAATLPLADIPRIKTGQPQGQERTVTAWKFLLLSSMLELMMKDPSCSLNLNGDVERIVGALRGYGFTGESAGKLLLSTSTQTVTIPIPTVGEIYRRENSPELDIFYLTPHMEQWVANARLDSKPLLVLDGLDSIFLNDDRYDSSLSSLVQAAYNLNQSLRHHGSSGVVAILMRNDVFSRVSTRVPDSQKMRDDSSLQLDWRVLSGALGLNSPLLQLVNSKAARALQEPFVDVLSYFPKDIQLGPRGGAPKWDPTLPLLPQLDEAHASRPASIIRKHPTSPGGAGPRPDQSTSAPLFHGWGYWQSNPTIWDKLHAVLPSARRHGRSLAWHIHSRESLDVRLGGKIPLILACS